MPETFEEFKKRVDHEIRSVCGVGSDDLVDAPWYDLYEDIRDMRGDDFRYEVLTTMAEADDTFAAMLVAEGIQYG